MEALGVPAGSQNAKRPTTGGWEYKCSEGERFGNTHLVVHEIFDPAVQRDGVAGVDLLDGVVGGAGRDEGGPGLGRGSPRIVVVVVGQRGAGRRGVLEPVVAVAPVAGEEDAVGGGRVGGRGRVRWQRVRKTGRRNWNDGRGSVTHFR